MLIQFSNTFTLINKLLGLGFRFPTIPATANCPQFNTAVTYTVAWKLPSPENSRQRGSVKPSAFGSFFRQRSGP